MRATAASNIMNFPAKILGKLIYLLTLLSVINAQEKCITPSFEDGFCVPYKNCPLVNELYVKYAGQIPQHLKDYIFQSKCSSEGDPMIQLCCTISDSTPTPPTAIVPDAMESRFNTDLDTNQDFAAQLNSQGFDILNELSCGTSDGYRVSGGNETDLAELPWMALLRYDVISGDKFLCGGSLISTRFVLTATHCVNRAVLPVVGVRLGEHDLLKNEDCVKKGYNNVCNPPVEDFGIDKIIAHPKYNERRRINDIALIKLDRNVEFKRHIKPVCLPITSSSMQMTGIEDGFLISGWGTTEKGSKSNVLLKAKVNSQERSVCENAYRIEITHKHLCAGDLETGRDTCRGDSGGPLMLMSKYKNVKRFIQYGVVASGGIACNLSQMFPGIYTNVINFLPWITDNIAAV